MTFKGLVTAANLLFIFIFFIHFYSTFISIRHSFFFIACFAQSGADLGFELGPAMQQACALPIEPRCTLKMTFASLFYLLLILSLMPSSSTNAKYSGLYSTAYEALYSTSYGENSNETRPRIHSVGGWEAFVLPHRGREGCVLFGGVKGGGGVVFCPGSEGGIQSEGVMRDILSNGGKEGVLSEGVRGVFCPKV
jgi:hypothetical protein